METKGLDLPYIAGGFGSAKLKAGPNDLRGLFRPK